MKAVGCRPDSARDAQPPPCARARPRADRQTGSLLGAQVGKEPNSEVAVARGLLCGRRVETHAVIDDIEDDITVVLAESQAHLTGGGMLDAVAKSLLGDPENELLRPGLEGAEHVVRQFGAYGDAAAP